MKLELLSDNLLLIINHILQNKEISKLLYYDSNTPLLQPEVENPNDLLLTSIFPDSFDVETNTDETTTLHIYYNEGELDGTSIEKSNIYFDIIYCKTLPLITIDNKPKLRHLEIMSRIIDYFSKNSIETIGKIKFKRFNRVTVNTKFAGIRFIGNTVTIGN